MLALNSTIKEAGDLNKLIDSISFSLLEEKKLYRINKNESISLHLYKDEANRVIHILSIDHTEQLLSSIDMMQSDILRDLDEAPGSVNQWKWYIYTSVNEIKQFYVQNFQDIDPVESGDVNERYSMYQKFISSHFSLMYTGFKEKVYESLHENLEDAVKEAHVHGVHSRVIAIMGNRNIMSPAEIEMFGSNRD